MLRYTLRQLEFAVTAADLGSVAAAAQALGVAQPSVSAAIQKLEDQLGLQIFIRQHALGVKPAPQAMEFLAEARNLLQHAQEFQREVQAAGSAIDGDLSIGSFATLAPAYAPGLIAGFREAHPAVHFRLEEGAQDQLFQGLRSGRYDLALLYKVDLPDDFAVTELAAIAPYVLLPSGHSLARQVSVSLHALASEPFILLDVLPSRTYFTRILTNAGLTPRIAFSSPSLEVVRGLVARDLGYSLLVTRPQGDLSYDGAALAVRPIAEDAEKAIVAIATLKHLRPTRLVSAFVQYCADYFSTAGRLS
jgi:DNA-binding transcriptional LysR family regulator